MKQWLSLVSGAVVGLSVVAVSFALDPPRQTSEPTKEVRGKGDAKSPRELEWDDLIPPDERHLVFSAPRNMLPLFEDDESGPAAMQEGSSKVNKELDGLHVKLPGFVVALTVDEKLRIADFLLVPYFGACIHVPPPPPNQIVYVKPDKPIQIATMYEPVWVIGKMSAKLADTDLAQASYTMTSIRIEPYEDW